MEKNRFGVYDLAYCALFTALMAVGAAIKIVLPIGVFSVTVSLQVFFAILAGLMLGGTRGFISVASYLVIGLMGVPVFAHGGGIFYLMKPTFGFLIGFAAAALISGAAYTGLKKKLPNSASLIMAAILGEAGYYICGLVYYYIMYNLILPDFPGIGIVELLTVWCFSTLIPDTLICLLSAQFSARVIPAVQTLISPVRQRNVK